MTDLSGELCVCGRDRPCYCDKTAVKQGPSAEAGARAEFGTAFSADTDADLRRVIMTVLNAAHGDAFEPHAPTVKRCMDALRNHTAAVPDDFLRRVAEECERIVMGNDFKLYGSDPDTVGELARALRDAGLCVRAEALTECHNKLIELAEGSRHREEQALRSAAHAIRALKGKR